MNGYGDQQSSEAGNGEVVGGRSQSETMAAVAEVMMLNLRFQELFIVSTRWSRNQDTG